MRVLDFNTILFYLKFGDELIEIAEPVGFDASDFSLGREDKKRLGRDVSFANGKSKLELYKDTNYRGLTHEFERVLTERNLNGFEAKVQFIVEIEGIQRVVGDLDYQTAETDELTYFKCAVIQDSNQVVIRRRKDVNVDVFSDEDLDGNKITPLVSEKVLLRATPIQKESTWKTSKPLGAAIPAGTIFGLSIASQFDKSEIQNTAIPLYGLFNNGSEDFLFLSAVDNLTNVVLEVSNGVWSMEDEGGGDTAQNIAVKIGTDFNTADLFFFDIPRDVTNYNTTINLRSLVNGEKLWLYFTVFSEFDGTVRNVQFDNVDISIKVTSTAISSVIEAFRLGNVMEYVIKSISGLNTIAPRFLEGGELYNKFITNGKLIRNIIDQPFEISLKKILGIIRMYYADYQIEDADNVFFGFYKDFYTNEDLGEFTQAPDQTFLTKFNERHTINKVELKFDKYEKENDEDKSREGVHTQVDYLTPNMMVENKMTIDIDATLDSFLIEKIRRDSFKVTKETATRDDEDIIVLDVIEKGFAFSETVYINHVVPDPLLLNLINDGSFNWSLMGIQINDFITITGQNIGTYRVEALGDTSIDLAAVGGANPTFEGIELTTIDYGVTSTSLTQRTNEGFDIITGTSNTEGFSNLRFTPKRIIKNYWANYLLSACFYQDTKDLKVTRYIHNRDLRTQEAANPLEREGDDIPIEDLVFNGTAILKPISFETTVIADTKTFFKLSEDIRTKRGFISIKKNDGSIIQGYAYTLEFDTELNLLYIEGEIANGTRNVLERREDIGIEIGSTTECSQLYSDKGYATAGYWDNCPNDTSTEDLYSSVGYTNTNYWD